MNEKSEKGKSISQSKLIPKDAQVIMSIMKDMDILDYEPRVINQLLEFIYRYVTCILDDARVYANHAKKKGIDLEDVKLAIEMTLEKSFTSPPPREILLEIARTKNNTPLPLIKPHAGLRLPPDRFCLSACNYKLKNNSRKIYQTIKVGSNFSMQSGTKMQNKPQNLQTVMKRTGTLPTMAKTQTVNMPKPVFKFSTTAQQKTISKSKIQIATGSQMTNAQQMIKTEIVKMEVDPTNLKRKREDDDYDL